MDFAPYGEDEGNSKNIMDIRIGKSAHGCAECEADFVHEQGIHSLVRVIEGQFERSDFCANCWGDTLAQGSYSTWNAQYYDPKVAEAAPEESFSPLRQTFYDAAEDTKSRTAMAIAYLSSQLLRRQKVFRLIKETKDPDTDASLILFNDRIANRLIEVNDENLSHAELEEARIFLMKRLAELEAPDEDKSGDEDADSVDTADASEDSVEEAVDDTVSDEDEFDDEDQIDEDEFEDESNEAPDEELIDEVEETSTV